MKRCFSCGSSKVENGVCSDCGFSSDSTKQFLLGTPLWRRQTSRNGDKSSFLSDKQPILTQIDYHNTAYKFPILKDNKEAHLEHSRKLRGWTEEWTESGSVEVRRTTKSLIVYLKSRLKSSIGSMGVSRTRHLEEAEREAREVAIRLGITIGEPEPIRKEIKIVEPFVSGVQFRTDKVKCVYPSGEIEFIDPKEAEKHTKNFIENMAMLNHAKLLEEDLLKFTKQLEIHYGVLGDISKAIDRLSAETSLLAKSNVKPTLWQRLKSLLQ